MGKRLPRGTPLSEDHPLNHGVIAFSVNRKGPTKTPKVRGSWRELPPDDPIYSRGFAIGVTRLRNYSADTTEQESEPLPKPQSKQLDSDASSKPASDDNDGEKPTEE